MRITLPGLAPALAGAAVLVFMTALGSFSAPYLFGGSFRVMTTQILASKQNGDLDPAEGETALLVAAALAGLWLSRRLDRRRDRAVAQHGTPPVPRRSPRRTVRLAAAAAGWTLALALLAPHATLLVLSFVPPGSWTTEAFPPVLGLGNYADLFSSMERLRPVVNSLWMAAVATAGALALGMLGAHYALTLRGRLGAALEWLIAVPWAIPGTAFAFALATTFSVHQPLAARLVLVGTPWLLPLAYLARALPVTGGAALAGLRRLDPSLAEAASSLGASPGRVFRKVTLPALAPALAAGASLALLAALGDFVLSIVLYTYDTRPISIEILSALRLQETGVAAAYGVLLAAASAVAFLLFGQERGGRALSAAVGDGLGARPAVVPHGHVLRGHARLPDGAAAAAVLRHPPGSRRLHRRPHGLGVRGGATRHRAALGPALRPHRPAPDDSRRAGGLGARLPALRAGLRRAGDGGALAGLAARRALRLALRPGGGDRHHRRGPGLRQRLGAAEERAKALGWLTAATSAGVMIGPAIGSLAATLGPAAPGLVAAALCVANVTFGFFYLPEPERAPAERGAGGEIAPRRSVRRMMTAVLAHPGRPAPSLIWIYALGMMAFMAMNAVLALYLQHRFGVTEKSIGYFYTFVGAVSLVMRSLVLGPAVARFGEQRVLQLGILALALGFALMPLAPGIPAFGLVVMLIPIGTALLFPSTTSLVSRVAERDEVGQTMGVQQAFGGVARMVGPMWAGAAFQHLSPAAPFWISAAPGAPGSGSSPPASVACPGSVPAEPASATAESGRRRLTAFGWLSERSVPPRSEFRSPAASVRGRQPRAPRGEPPCGRRDPCCSPPCSSCPRSLPAAPADEGMWTFNGFPFERFEKAYGFRAQPPSCSTTCGSLRCATAAGAAPPSSPPTAW